MGVDSLIDDPVFRCDLARRCWGEALVVRRHDHDVELLLEPFQEIPLEKAFSSFAKMCPSAELLAKLRRFAWVSVSILELQDKLRPDEPGRMILTSKSLRERGVKRIWPNLFLYPQPYQSYYKSGSADRYMEAIDADPNSSDGADINWALIDTDVRDTHRDLAGADIERFETGEPDRGVQPAKGKYPRPGPGRCNHGTHLAGLIHRLAPAARIVSIGLPVMKNPPGEEQAFALLSTAHLESALQWIAEKRDDIHGVNVSLGISPQTQDQLVGVGPGAAAVKACVAAGKVVVIAAGNYGRNSSEFREVSITDPANAHDAIVVGACGSEDPRREGIWSGSSHGPTADGREKPDLVAPGVDIESCGDMGDSDRSAQNGTSQAAAIVSGALAAAMSKSTSLRSPADWRDHLLSTCRSLGRQNTYQGKGVLNVKKLISRAAGGPR